MTPKFTPEQEAAIAVFDSRLGRGAFLRVWDGIEDFDHLWNANCEMQIGFVRETVDAATSEMNRIMTPNAQVQADRAET